MKTKLTLLLFSFILVDQSALAGYLEGTQLDTGEKKIVCEYALSGKIAKDALEELKTQFFERPFTIYHQYEDRTKTSYQELGLEWLRGPKIDGLLLKARLSKSGASMIAGVLGDDKLEKVLETEYVADDPVLWREMFIKPSETKLSYDDVTGIYPAREPSFKSSFPHPVGFHTLVNRNGVRKYLEIGDLEFDNIAVTIGIDVPCKDVKKYITLGDEENPLRLKTETQQFCRIPILTFARSRLQPPGSNL
ncbi:MAG: hypothetical protein ACXVA9_02230 [Bdellovibrionales bacterium]